MHWNPRHTPSKGFLVSRAHLPPGSGFPIRERGRGEKETHKNFTRFHDFGGLIWTDPPPEGKCCRWGSGTEHGRD